LSKKRVSLYLFYHHNKPVNCTKKSL